MSDGSAALSSDASSVGAGSEADWQRLHPATLALSIVRLGPRTVNFLPALAAIGIAGKWIYVLPALGVFLLLSLAAAWFGWLRFRFHVGADQIAIESGIFARQQDRKSKRLNSSH